MASETACTMKIETCFELERRKDAIRKLTKRKRHFLKIFPFLESPTRQKKVMSYPAEYRTCWETMKK